MSESILTCWTIVQDAARGDGEACSLFARTYLDVVRAFLGKRWRQSAFASQVDDAVQEVSPDNRRLTPMTPLLGAPMNENDPLPRLDRRQLLRGAGALGLFSLVGAGATTRRLPAAPSRVILPNFGKPMNACTLTASTTEGPYWFNAALLRREMSEGRNGFPTQLVVQVVRANTCAPIPNAIVDVWHCDAGGVYAGYGGQPGGVDAQGDNFMRAVQVTDANGYVSFLTVFPGWYQGRTQHVHFKVLLSNQTLVTSQWFFSDTVTDEIYSIVEPYNARAARTTRNSNDGIYSPQLEMSLTPDKGGIAAGFTIVVA